MSPLQSASARKININTDGMQQQQQHPSLPPHGQTPPPGLFTMTPSASPALPPGPIVGSSMDSPRGSSHYDRGVAFRVADGAVSAPPPPGFGAAPDQRDGTLRVDLVRGLLGERSAIPADRQQQEALLRPSSITGVPSIDGTAGFTDGPEAITHPSEDQPNSVRTSSFANLAAALGEGLAESMDDSLQKQRQQQQQQFGEYPSEQGRDGEGQDLYRRAPRPSSLRNHISGHGGENRGEMDNLSRQSRHMASRRVGSSTSADMGYDLRISSATGTAVLPARMLSSRDRVGPSSTAQDTEGAAPVPAQTLIAPLRPGQGRSASPSQAPIGSGPIGVTVVEPGSRTNSPHLSNPMTQGTALSVHQTILSSSRGNEMDGRILPGGTFYTRGRSSAPPQVFDDESTSKAVTTSVPLRVQHAASSLQQRAADFRELGQHLREKQHSPSGEALRSSPAPASLAHVSAHPSHPSAHPLPQTAHLNSKSMVQAEEELSPFLWDVIDSAGSGAGMPSLSRTPSPMNRTSRGLAILHAAHLFIPDVRSTCEAFGALMSFRPEFCKNRGVIFISYHDLRSARYAAVELRSCLKRLATPHGEVSDNDHDVQVRYCVPLNASSANDESIIVVSNAPRNFDRESLNVVMSAFGAVRGVRYDALGEYSKEHSYIVEFYDVQDAKQALLELESIPPWGTETTATVGVRQPSERKQGQELLALIGRWRQGGQRVDPTSVNVVLAPGASPSPLPLSEVVSGQPSGTPAGEGKDAVPTCVINPPKPTTPESSNSNSPMPQAPDVSAAGGATPASGVYSHVQGVVQPTTQLAVGPDGQYSYIVLNQPSPHVIAPHHNHLHSGQAVINAHPPVQQQIIHGPHGTYVTSIPAQVPSYHDQPHYVIHHHPHPHMPHVPQYHHIPGGTVISASPYGYPGTVPVYAPMAAHNAPVDSSVSSGSTGGVQHFQGNNYVSGHAPTAGRGGSNASGSASRRSHGAQVTSRTSGGDEDTAQLVLDINTVETGKDTRTSLMVRNIPNKYTQQMLLTEFAEGGHGSDKIDFFYLPIDFKNKCNRGYAFVNFVDYRDIVPFFHRYNGKHWKVFNSDKICEITYARIQGKTAMLKRFQNSALMEKDDEYKPLVFVSHGTDKGKREDFPPATNQHSPSLSSLAEAAASKGP